MNENALYYVSFSIAKKYDYVYECIEHVKLFVDMCKLWNNVPIFKISLTLMWQLKFDYVKGG